MKFTTPETTESWNSHLAGLGGGPWEGVTPVLAEPQLKTSNLAEYYANIVQAQYCNIVQRCTAPPTARTGAPAKHSPLYNSALVCPARHHLRGGRRTSPGQKTAWARQSSQSITSERSGTGNRARAGVLSKHQSLHPRVPSKQLGHARAPKASQVSELF